MQESSVVAPSRGAISRSRVRTFAASCGGEALDSLTTRRTARSSASIGRGPRCGGARSAALGPSLWLAPEVHWAAACRQLVGMAVACRQTNNSQHRHGAGTSTDALWCSSGGQLTLLEIWAAGGTPLPRRCTGSCPGEVPSQWTGRGYYMAETRQEGQGPDGVAQARHVVH